MTTPALRERYADALLRRMESHEGPLADLAPVMDRLDVLAGVDLEQKRLSAPDVEHGAGATEGDASSPVAEPSAPVVHEVAQETPVSASAGPAPEVAFSLPPEPGSTSPAPSPEPVISVHIPAEPYTAPSTSRDSKTQLPCDCGCGTVLTLFPYEIKAKPNGPYFVNRDHRSTWLRSDHPDAAAMRARYGSRNKRTTQRPVVLTSQTPRPAPTEPLAPTEAPEPPVAPARGLTAVLERPAVIECSCAGYHEHVAGFRADIANEAHARTCPMYRVGGHVWQMPKQGEEASPPFTVRCRFCTETRQVDRMGREWPNSPSNPANGGLA